MLSFIVPATVLGLLVVFALITSTDSPGIFVSVPCVIMVCGGTGMALLLSFKPADISSAILRGLKGEPDSGRADMILAQGRAYAMVFGAMGFFVGVIAMLSNLNDPSQFGVGLAVALLSVLYALMIGEVLFRALRCRLRREEESPGGGESLGEDSTTVVSLMAVLAGLFACGALQWMVMG